MSDIPRPHDNPPAELPLTAAIADPRIATDDPPMLIVYHGYGASERDLLPIAAECDPRLRIVSARAPIDLAPMGMPGGYAWFDLTFRPEGIDYDRASASRGAEIAGLFVHAAQQRWNTPPQRTFLLGFSQGAMMAHACLLDRRIDIAGAVCMSGRAVDEVFTPERDWNGLEGFPLFVSHGIHDDVIPISVGGRAIRKYYQDSPVELTYREYDAPHAIPQDNLDEVREWLDRRLSGLFA